MCSFRRSEREWQKAKLELGTKFSEYSRAFHWRSQVPRLAALPTSAAFLYFLSALCLRSMSRARSTGRRLTPSGQRLAHYGSGRGKPAAPSSVETHTTDP